MNCSRDLQHHSASDDNYVSLLPGESRELTARYDSSALVAMSRRLEVDGWNVAP